MRNKLSEVSLAVIAILGAVVVPNNASAIGYDLTTPGDQSVQVDGDVGGIAIFDCASTASYEHLNVNSYPSDSRPDALCLSIHKSRPPSLDWVSVCCLSQCLWLRSATREAYYLGFLSLLFFGPRVSYPFIHVCCPAFPSVLS